MNDLTNTGISRDSTLQVLASATVDRAKRAYSTRRADAAHFATLVSGRAVRPSPGDLVLATVDRLGKHSHLELASGRRSSLFAGDTVIVAYGNRYAPDQFEAFVPDHLGPCHLAAGGGIASEVLCRHANVAAPTAITPLGLIADAEGTVVNLSRYALDPSRPSGALPPVIACVGTSMNAGKTTSAAHLIRGLTSAGVRVGAAKVTGTGSGNDPWLLRDAGAVSVLDFTDAGHASTFPLPAAQVEAVFLTLVAHLQRLQVGAIVLEVADGVLQNETAALLKSDAFRAIVDGVVFAAADSMGACAGVRWLHQAGLPVTAICGTVTQSPLGLRETAVATRCPVVGLRELSDPKRAAALLAEITPIAWGVAA